MSNVSSKLSQARYILHGMASYTYVRTIINIKFMLMIVFILCYSKFSDLIIIKNCGICFSKNNCEVKIHTPQVCTGSRIKWHIIIILISQNIHCSVSQCRRLYFPLFLRRYK